MIIIHFLLTPVTSYHQTDDEKLSTRSGRCISNIVFLTDRRYGKESYDKTISTSVLINYKLIKGGRTKSFAYIVLLSD